MAAANPPEKSAHICDAVGCPTGSGELSSAPPSLTPPRPPARCVQDLYAKLLRGADEALNTVLRQDMPAKDLQSFAYVATILLRSAKQLEEAEPDEPSQDELARAQAEAEALLAETKRRAGG